MTNFSFEFFYESFTEDASLRLLYHGAKKSKMTKNSNQGGSCLKTEMHMTQEPYQKRHQKGDFCSKLEHVYLLFDCRWSPAACQLLTFLPDISALSKLTITYKL